VKASAYEMRGEHRNLKCTQVVCSENRSIVVCFDMYFQENDSDSCLEFKPEKFDVRHIIFLGVLRLFYLLSKPVCNFIKLAGVLFIAIVTGFSLNLNSDIYKGFALLLYFAFVLEYFAIMTDDRDFNEIFDRCKIYLVQSLWLILLH